MRPLYGEPCLRRATTGRLLAMVDRVMTANGTRQMADLPEEARVRLYRQVSAFLEREREADWERRLGAGPLTRFRLWFADVRELWRQALLS